MSSIIVHLVFCYAPLHRLPTFSLPCAIDVLTLGSYPRLPSCIRVSFHCLQCISRKSSLSSVYITVNTFYWNLYELMKHSKWNISSFKQQLHGKYTIKINLYRFWNINWYWMHTIRDTCVFYVTGQDSATRCHHSSREKTDPAEVNTGHTVQTGGHRSPPTDEETQSGLVYKCCKSNLFPQIWMLQKKKIKFYPFSKWK